MPHNTMAQLKMKTQPKQLLDSLPLDIALRATFKPTVIVCRYAKCRYGERRGALAQLVC